MTVTAQVPSYIQIPGNGTGTVFAFPFKCFATTDVIVGFVVNGLYTAQASGFTIGSIDVNGGGTVTFAAPPSIGTLVDIRTVTPLIQPSEFANLGAFAPEVHTDTFDRVVRELQDVFRRTYTFGIHGPDNEATPWPALPAAAARAGLALIFDPVTGLPTLGASVTGTITGTLIAQLLNQVNSLAPIGDRIIAANENPASIVNYSYKPLDIRRYGADPTGFSASDTAMAAAISACGPNGGTIKAPAGTYTFANSITLQGAQSIIIQGDGATTAGGFCGTKFTYTGTAATWINCNSAVGVQFKGIQFIHSNAGFSGTYATFNHGGPSNDSTFCGFFDCILGSTLSPTIHLNLDKCTLFTVERCNFINGNPSVKGQSNAGNSYANDICFRDCLWLGSQAAPIQDGGQGWVIDSCTFEGIAAGAAVNAAILSSNANGAFTGLKITGCWFGDCDTTAGTLISLLGSQGVEISGNYISGGTNTTAIAMGQTCQGWSITGNLFIGHLNGINFASTVCANISVKGNVASSVTNPWVNPGNCVFGTLDVGPNFGLGLPSGHYSLTTNPAYRTNSDGSIEMYGTSTVISGTPLAVTFPNGGFPNSIPFVFPIATVPGSPGQVAYLSGSITKTGFTLNCSGSGTNTVTWRALGS